MVIKFVALKDIENSFADGTTETDRQRRNPVTREGYQQVRQKERFQIDIESKLTERFRDEQTGDKQHRAGHAQQGGHHGRCRRLVWFEFHISGSGAGRRAPFLSRERSERQGGEEHPSLFTSTVWQPVFTSWAVSRCTAVPAHVGVGRCRE